MLKIPKTLVTEHGELKLILVWRFHLSWSIFIVVSNRRKTQSLTGKDGRKEKAVLGEVGMG